MAKLLQAYVQNTTAFDLKNEVSFALLNNGYNVFVDTVFLDIKILTTLPSNVACANKSMQVATLLLSNENTNATNFLTNTWTNFSNSSFCGPFSILNGIGLITSPLLPPTPFFSSSS